MISYHNLVFPISEHWTGSPGLQSQPQCNASCLTCHPRVSQTLVILKQCPLWPLTLKNTLPTANKTSHLKCAGFLHPLPAPHRLWTHISIDFVTGLPPPKGNTAILTIVDRFSKMIHLLLPKIPSAKDRLFEQCLSLFVVLCDNFVFPILFF